MVKHSLVTMNRSNVRMRSVDICCLSMIVIDGVFCLEMHISAFPRSTQSSIPLG